MPASTGRCHLNNFADRSGSGAMPGTRSERLAAPRPTPIHEEATGACLNRSAPPARMHLNPVNAVPEPDLHRQQPDHTSPEQIATGPRFTCRRIPIADSLPDPFRHHPLRLLFYGGSCLEDLFTRPAQRKGHRHPIPSNLVNARRSRETLQGLDPTVSDGSQRNGVRSLQEAKPQPVRSCCAAIRAIQPLRGI
ncbi:hypothetical protein SAMN06295987_101225 [Novosphingobium mathurense]|uniref:Uncharacterized protein n=1 Tax=Novosphingobium mathurense TaxID=428990 RepID=A0A1U6GS87_9SPHN|nr:hypothetical protein SAMN06295987_101225 [Novosphingobium mathurense]